MKITVPFIYAATIVKPRCRVPSFAYIKDSIKVDIKEVDAELVPVAFKVGKKLTRWDGKNLYRESNDSNAKHSSGKVSIEEVVNNTNPNLNYIQNDLHPFARVWDCFDMGDLTFIHGNNRGTSNLRNCERASKNVQYKGAVQHREWVEDNKDKVIAKIKNIANDLLVVDGFLLTKTDGEPYYYCQTFGLGHNHGGTGLFIGATPRNSKLEKFGFNASQYDEAVAYVSEKSTTRGDDNNLPIDTNCGQKIEVLIPQAVTLKKPEPLKQTLFLVRGISGSGKSTTANKLSSTVVEADMFFVDDQYRYKYNHAYIKDAHKWCQMEVKRKLLAGASVAVANTFIRKWELEPYLAMAKEFGVEVEIITCKGDYNNIHGVPDNVIARMKENFEP